MTVIRYLAWLSLGYSDRSSRAPYVLGLLGAMLTLCVFLFAFEDPQAIARKQWTPVSVSVAIMYVWTATALLVKRLRDVGLDWVWVFLLVLAPIQLTVLFEFAVPKGKPDEASGLAQVFE